MSESTAPVLVERRKRVLLVTINRPQAKNAPNATAEVIAANGPLALQVSKRIARHSDEWSPVSGWAEHDAEASVALASADAAEGATAFVERRAPLWTGR
ncbi:MAG: hypothetical protein ACK5MT_03160 [Actinomycetales bacterium]